MSFCLPMRLFCDSLTSVTSSARIFYSFTIYFQFCIAIEKTFYLFDVCVWCCSYLTPYEILKRYIAFSSHTTPMDLIKYIFLIMLKCACDGSRVLTTSWKKCSIIPNKIHLHPNRRQKKCKIISKMAAWLLHWLWDLFISTVSVAIFSLMKWKGSV